MLIALTLFFFSSRRRHTRLQGDWSSDVCSSDLKPKRVAKIMSRLRSRASAAQSAFWIASEPEAAHSTFVKRLPPGRLCNRSEIGRASCRERVKMRGVGVVEKKKRMLVAVNPVER